ncbi:hypothetical protein R6Z07M_019680 [Ovis aries]
MKAVFLTLILGLVCGAQETPAETEITGDWNTIYIAVDNKEKIQQGGPLRAYIHHFECINNCEQLSVTFYIKASYNCTLLTVVGTREEDVYVVNYMGENSFEVNRVSGNLILFYAENFDGVRKTKVTHALGIKGDSLTQEDIHKHEELNSERGIPNENIDDATKTDSCPK